ncbi:hypothetical protein FBU59_007304, partial [Linderina macrospora]
MSSKEYSIRQILGRRISLRDGVWYLIDWENFDLTDSTWLCDNEECNISPVAIEEFERKCTELREQRARDPTIKDIDIYENEGIATLIGDGYSMFAAGDSVFKDREQPEDFSFHGNAMTEAAQNNQQDNNRIVAVATHGWNRMKSPSTVAPKHVPKDLSITGICGRLVDTAGGEYYLTRWNDGAITWEHPPAFDRAQDVLERYELAQYARERKVLCDSLRKPQMSYSRSTPRRRIGSLESNRGRGKTKKLLSQI